MSADNKCIVVLIDTGAPPNLIMQEVKYDPIGGASGVEAKIASGLQIVALYNVRDLNGDMGGPFWDEFSGNSQYRVQGVFDGVNVAKRDTTGATKGAITRTYFANSTAPGKQTTVEAQFEDTVMGQGAGWSVYENGEGALYEAELAKARTLVGLPT
jgi:hypothetical protein